MAIRAYLLIETAAGKSDEVLTALRDMAETIQADKVTGPYDVICVLKLQELNDLGTVVKERIHPIGGITRTMSCVSFSGISSQS